MKKESERKIMFYRARRGGVARAVFFTLRPLAICIRMRPLHIYYTVSLLFSGFCGFRRRVLFFFSQSSNLSCVSCAEPAPSFPFFFSLFRVYNELFAREISSFLCSITAGERLFIGFEGIKNVFDLRV